MLKNGAEPRDAELVVFKKVKRFAPGFHQHILASKVRGQVVQMGERILTYEVTETIPVGSVKVTEKTQLSFQ